MQFNELFSDLTSKFFLAMGGYIAFVIQQDGWITAPENETTMFWIESVGFVVHSWFVKEYSILSFSHMSSKFPWNIISNMVFCNIISNMVFCCVIAAFAGKIFSGISLQVWLVLSGQGFLSSLCIYSGRYKAIKA
jgi:hypothetical protein